MNMNICKFLMYDFSLAFLSCFEFLELIIGNAENLNRVGECRINNF